VVLVQERQAFGWIGTPLLRKPAHYDRLNKRNPVLRFIKGP